jgi:hypothetical protein
MIQIEKGGNAMTGVMSRSKIRDIKAYLRQAPGNTIPFERSDKTFRLKELRYDGKAITDENETFTLTYEELEHCWKYAVERLNT